VGDVRLKISEILGQCDIEREVEAYGEDFQVTLTIIAVPGIQD
jgi:hypothetical protein